MKSKSGSLSDSYYSRSYGAWKSGILPENAYDAPRIKRIHTPKYDYRIITDEYTGLTRVEEIRVS